MFPWYFSHSTNRSEPISARSVSRNCENTRLTCRSVGWDGAKWNPSIFKSDMSWDFIPAYGPDVSAGYAIEPIRGERDGDPITKLMEDAWLAVHGEPLAPIPPPVVGWQLTLCADSSAIERREFGTEGFADAQDAGSAWLQQHSGDSIDAFTARAMQASRRMAWDHGHRHDIGRRGF